MQTFSVSFFCRLSVRQKLRFKGYFGLVEIKTPVKRAEKHLADPSVSLRGHLASRGLSVAAVQQAELIKLMSFQQPKDLMLLFEKSA